MDKKDIKKSNNKNSKKERSVVEYLNDVVDKIQSFTDEKLDNLEEKFNKYTID